jgi:FKBP-type peptidyl-prolyl cis-trans isomerase FkpA
MMKSMYKLMASVACALALAACGGGGNDTPTTTIPTQPAFTKTDTAVGTGIEATAGDLVTVNYTGWLYVETATDKKGAQFDTSIGKSPFSFQLGKGSVIAGWDQGLLGMKVGGKRTLIIPSTLAYGSSGNGAIPANAPLIFEVQMLAISR